MREEAILKEKLAASKEKLKKTAIVICGMEIYHIA